MQQLIKVKPKDGMLVYDTNAKIIPASGLMVENSKYYRQHIKDKSLEVVTKKVKGAK